MSTGARAPAPSLATDTGWLAARHLRLMQRRPASIFGAIVLPLLFTALFFTVFRGVMERAGIDYAQYLLPAVIIQAMFFTAMSGSIWAAEDASSGMIDRLRSLPIARSAPVLSLLGGQIARAVVSLAVLIAAGHVLGFRFSVGWWQTAAFVAVALGFAAAICLAYLTLGFAIARPEPVQAIGGLVFYPLLLLSNAFAPTEAFPDRLQPIVAGQPVSRVAEALRALSSGSTATVATVAIAVVWIGAILVVFAPLGARAFGRSS